ncbi:DEAD/DEAH box helicase family protein [Asticcacaulis sp. YBE204]
MTRRILLSLATGTGKTSIAFQIAWKLFSIQMESEP